MNQIEAYLKHSPLLTAAVVGYITQGDEVLLGIRKRVSFGLGEQLISGIGGKVEPGESDEAALRREYLEEIKVTATVYQKLGQVTYLFPHKPQWNQQVSIFLIEAWRGDPQETEAIKPLWVKQTALPKDRMWPDNLYTLPLVLARKTIEGTFLYDEIGQISEYKLKEIV